MANVEQHKMPDPLEEIKKSTPKRAKGRAKITEELRAKIKYLYQLNFNNNKISLATGLNQAAVAREVEELKKRGTNTFSDFAWQRLVGLINSEDETVALMAIKIYLNHREITANQEIQNKIKTEDLALRRGENQNTEAIEEIKNLLAG